MHNMNLHSAAVGINDPIIQYLKMAFKCVACGKYKMF